MIHADVNHSDAKKEKETMITCTSCKYLTNTDEDGMILTCRLSGASCFTNDLPFTTLPGCPKKERNSMLNELAKQIHEIAVAHGWWEDERPFPEIVALCHSELSEALEEYRRGRPWPMSCILTKPRNPSISLT